MPLPKLIFAENHCDPITGRILAKLLPELQKLGYNCFLDEMPKDTTVKNHIQIIEDNESRWNKVAVKLKNEYKIDINDSKSLNNSFFLDNPGKKYLYFLKRHPADVTFKTFLNSLTNHQMEYKGIDEEPDNKSATAREKDMAETYVESKQTVFGRVGRAHVQGIQKEILKNNSSEVAAANYCFFDIYSQSSAVGSLQERIQKNELKLPLGITSINTSDHDEESLIHLILKTIQQKTNEINKQKKIAKQSWNLLSFLLSTFSLFSSKEAESSPSTLKKTSHKSDEWSIKGY